MPRSPRRRSSVRCWPIPYEDDEDAIRIANHSKYGLSGAISSASLDRAQKMARRIRTGTISVNGGGWFGPDREHGLEGFEEYLQTKTLGLPVS